MGRTTNAVVCSYKTLTELTGYSRTSIANSLKILRDDNWIETIKIGNATAYCVNGKNSHGKHQEIKEITLYLVPLLLPQNRNKKVIFKKNQKKSLHIFQSSKKMKLF